MNLFMHILRRLAGNPYAERIRNTLAHGLSIAGAIARRLSFPGDSLVLLALLLAANLLRIYLPGLVADGVFGVTVLLLALSLFRERLPASARTTVLCFAALLGVYGIRMLLEFRIQGAGNLVGILFAGAIFAFCYQNAPTLIRAKYAIPLLLAAALALFPLYLLPAELNPNTFSTILGTLLATVGLIVIARSDNRKKRHWRVHILFLLIVVVGIVFGSRSLVLVVLLAYPLYWCGYFFLQNRLRTSALVVTAGVLIGAPIMLLGTSFSNTLETTIGHFVSKYTGGSLQSGRETFWRHSLAAFSESPWLGRGPGAVITRPTGNLPDLSAEQAGYSPPSARPSNPEPSCLDRSNPGLLGDCAALLEARNTLARDSAALWSWVPSNPPHSWIGIKIEGVPARVVAVNLRQRKLAGAIPLELGRLDKLERLNLSGNALTGPIPPELGGLANMRVLALNDNALSGSIPPELGTLENLEELSLRGNRLSGEAPSELANLADLSLLYLAGNDFASALPPALYDVASHDLDQDLLCLPSSHVREGLLADCEALLAARDSLAGAAALDWRLSRPISKWQGVELGGAPVRTVAVNLPEMGLRGVIPAELGRLDKLEMLNLSGNALTGPIPPELGRLSHLQVLALADNALTGPIPPSLGALENIKELRLRDNRLSGGIPPELGRPFGLSLLRLAGNELLGGLPPTLDHVDDHDFGLDLFCVPSSRIGRGLLDDCTVLLEARDVLAGAATLDWRRSKLISRWQGVKLGGAPVRIVTMNLPEVGLRGIIPPALERLDRLELLRLSRNALTGPIPPELGRLSRLRVLSLDDNALNGSIPPELGTLENLEELWLRGNRLSGEVPSELASLSNLSLLRLAGNDFSGILPPALYDVANTDLDRSLHCVPSPFIFAGLLADCTSLLDVRDRLAGDAALNWQRSRPIPQWQGVKIGSATESARVIGLDLTGAGLNGRIPPQLGELEQLVSLRLHDNALTGPIPPALGALKNLEELWLRGNRLSGEAPSELASLANLSLLRLAGNDFSGILPSALYDVASHDLDRDLHCPAAPRSNTGLVNDCVVLLEVQDKLTGGVALDWSKVVPIEFWQGVVLDGTPARVVELNLPSMELSGIVPSALSELDRLAKLNLVQNNLTGPIPPELGRLTHLRELLLGGNALSGSIPPQLGGLEQLTMLHLYENRLSGPIPPELGELRNLRGLSLASNRLSGSIPMELGRLANLRWLNLQINRLTGAIPPTLGRLGKLEFINLADNDFSEAPLRDAGSDEANPGLLADRAILLAARDALAGAASLNWSDLTPLDFWDGVVLGGTPARVVELNLPSMGLSGIVPPALSDLDRLAKLNLVQNTLAGPIPPELGRLTHLRELLLGGNALSGSIPPQLGGLEQLTMLHLYENRLSGPIPPELGELRNLRGLSLASNRLSGSIPMELGRLANLRWLNLQINRLTGAIPPTLGRLGKLEFINLAHNDFVDAEPEDSGLPGQTEDNDVGPEPALPALAGGHDSALPDRISPSINPGLLTDRAILLAARDALAGAASLNWSDSTPLDFWDGVVLGGEPARVTALHLPERGLSGGIPPALGGLDRLATLRLHRNQLTGPIPPELGRLTELRELALGSNALSGPIPPQLGNSGQLALLHLRRNQLTGPIPPELAGLTKLRTLAIDSNALSGLVPRELAKLSNLEELRLAGNRLDLPPELAAFHEPSASNPDRGLAADATMQRAGLDLFCLDADAQTEGVAGDCAALLAARDVLAGEYTLNWNRTTPIGAWQGVAVGGAPPRVFAVNLSREGLTGSIPAELGRLEKLVWLDLDGNALTGPIPAELGTLANLRRLTLDGNVLTGSIPPELGNLSSLEELRLAGNRLTGPVPSELAALDDLSVLRLGGNEFTGCLPWELQGMADRELELDLLCDPSMVNERGLREDAIVLMEMRDVLAGRPDQRAEQTSGETAGASLNWSYAIPISSWDGVTLSLVRPAGPGAQGDGATWETERVIGLDLSGMGLAGRLPPALGRLEKLVWLRLNDNRLTGAIPPELGQLADLRELGLESNALTGPVPPQLGQLANLSELWLGRNRLTGAIPPELAALDALSVLHLRDNEFTGCLPPLGKMANQFRTRPDGLPKCGAPPDKGFSTLGEAIKSLNDAVDPSSPAGVPASTHNLYLQVGLQTGAFGLGALALLCASLIFNLRARAGAKVTPVHCYAAACTIAVLVHNTFEVYLLQNVFTAGCVGWILVGLGAGAVNHLSSHSAQASGEPVAEH